MIRRAVDQETSVAANRRWWDDEAAAYQAEHGAFSATPTSSTARRWREADLHLLGPVWVVALGSAAAPLRVALAGPGGARVVATDLSRGMLLGRLGENPDGPV